MKNKNLNSAPGRAVAGGILFGILCALGVQANDWPSFRNSGANTGNSGETIPGALVEKWHSTEPHVEESGVVVAGGVAYMASEEGHIYAFDVTTGFLKPGFPVATAFNYGTPAVDVANNRVYALAGSSLYAYELDGTEAFPPLFVGGSGLNYNQGPVLDGGFVYLNAGGSVHKINSAGVEQWATSTDGGDTQPAVFGGFVYTDNAGVIQKYNATTGAQVIGGGFPISVAGAQCSVAVADNMIFHKGDQLYAYSTANGALLWSAADGGGATYYDSPGVAGGAVYVYGFDGVLYAFNETTGATLPGFPTAAIGNPGDRNWSSPAVANNKVFVGAGTTQRLFTIGAAGTADAGTVLGSNPTFSSDPQGFDLCSPAISGGYVFAMLDGGGLYCFYGGSGNPPSGALKINNDDVCTESRDVTLTLSNNGNPNVTEMIISEDPFFTGASFQAYAATSPFTLSAGFGTKTVYAQLKDNQGQLSNVFTDQIEYREVCIPCGDLDHDGDVDATDRAIIQNLIKTHTYNAEADYDHNGVINLSDYRQWYECYKAYLSTHSAQ